MPTSRIIQESSTYVHKYMKMNLIISDVICIFNKILKNIFLRSLNIFSPNLFIEGTYTIFYVQYMKHILIICNVIFHEFHSKHIYSYHISHEIQLKTN